MNSKSLAWIAIFSAIAVVLNVIRIPAIYWPAMVYMLCEIPVLVAFLLFGFKIGFLVEVIHILGQEIFFSVGPAGIVFYPMGIFIHLFMFSGIYLANRYLNHRVKEVDAKKRTLFFTGFAAALRGTLQPIIDYGLLYYFLMPLVLGYSFPSTYIMALVPSFVVYNVTSTLYEVPIAYLIAKRACMQLKIKPFIQL